jgi:beta-glucosidase
VEVSEAAQRAAAVRLTAADSGRAAPPLSTDPAVYAENIGSAAAAGPAIDNLATADRAVLRLNAAFEPRPGGFESFFQAGSLEFPAEQDRILALCKQVPTIIVPFLDRPAIVPELVRRGVPPTLVACHSQQADAEDDAARK